MSAALNDSILDLFSDSSRTCLDRVKYLSENIYINNSHLWRHVSACAHPGVGSDVNLIGLTIKPDREAKVSDGAGSVPLDEDVLGLDVPVGHGGLPLGPEYLGVEVADALGGGQGHLEAGLVVQDVAGEEVVQRSSIMIVCDQQHLGPASSTCNTIQIIQSILNAK